MKKKLLVILFFVLVGLVYLYRTNMIQRNEPIIASIEPNNAAVGNRITIRGKNFGEECKNDIGDRGNRCQRSVIFSNGIESKFTNMDRHDLSWDDHSIQIKIPRGAKSGKIRIRLIDQGFSLKKKYGTRNIVGPEITILPKLNSPMITSMTPAHAMRGDRVTLYGKNLREGCIGKNSNECLARIHIGETIIDFQSGQDPHAILWTPDQIIFDIPKDTRKGVVNVFQSVNNSSIRVSGKVLTIHLNRIEATREQEISDFFSEANALHPDRKSKRKNVVTNFENIKDSLQLNLNRDLVAEGMAEKILTNIVGHFESPENLVMSPKKYSFIFYIAYDFGTTADLQSQERAEILSSWRRTYKKNMPSSVKEWVDVFKIANGRTPQLKDLSAENEAKAYFQKIYKREPDPSNSSDQVGLSLLAYHLRPQPSDPEKEMRSTQFFKEIFHYQPRSLMDLQVVRTIAYSGAVQ